MTGIHPGEYNSYNEVRVHAKFAVTGGHKHIIPVLKHGWVEENRTYFFDMERCPLTLQSFICYEFRNVIGLQRYFSPTSENLGILTFWEIVRHITNGLQFIHDMEEIHRDLKPSNGNDLGFGII